MASWEYFIYSKSGKYSPEEIAQRLIAKGYEEGINCKATAKQEINRDHFMVLGERFEENINVPQGKEGVMFSSGNGNEEDIKNIFNLFQRRDIEVKLNYKFGDIDYKSYFDDAPLDVNGKTYFAELKSEKEMMTQDYTPGIHFETQEQFDNSTKYKDTRYHFYNCTFDDIHFSDNVVIGQFEKCRFNRCTFEDFDAESINFNDSVLTNCSIANSNFKNCNFENAGFYQSQISKSDLTNANFATANMKRTRFDENNLSAVKFHGATLNGVIITEPTINKPIEGLFTENITWDGATYEEIETLRKNIFSRLKLEPVTFAQKVEAVERSLEPLPEAHLETAKGNLSLSNDQTVDKLIIYDITFDDENYMHFNVDADGYRLDGYFRVFDPSNGNSMEIVHIENYDSHPVISEHWNDIEQQCKMAAAEKYKVLVKAEQFEIINRVNPAPNTYQTWIRNIDDVKSFDETLKDSDWEGWEQNGFDESYTPQVVQDALNSGKITVYSSYPIEQGVFVTPSPMEAKSYSGDGNIYSKEVDLNAVAWIDPTQGQYANVEEYKLLSPSEIEIKCNGEDWSIVDKFSQKELEIPSGYTPDELLYAMAQKCPEYRDFVNNNFDKLLNDINNAEQAISDEAINGDWIQSPETQSQATEPTLAEQKIAEVKEKLSNPQPIKQSLTREEFDNLTSEIAEIAKNYQADSKLAAEFFAFKAQFYQYSPNNALLIHLQNPHATFVASFTKWRDMGYSLKKGAKHMKISRPIERAKFPRDVNGKTKMIDVKNANAEEKAKIANGEIKVEKVTKFVPHQVFDISQTTCPPEDYPKIYSMGVLDIEKAQLYECIAEYARDTGFSVSEEDMSSISLNGYYKPSDDSIHINSLLQDSKKLETMAHELAHGVLHKTTTQPTEIAEFEAESFATMLQRKLGFPVSEDSKRYIKNYFEKSSSLTKAKFDMNDTLNRLSKAFKHVSTGIDNKLEEMGYGNPREKGRSLEQAKAQAVDPVKISSNFTQAL